MANMVSSNRQDELGNLIPKSGQWPVEPQEDVPVADDRIWIDGCFDFSHHGECSLSILNCLPVPVPFLPKLDPNLNIIHMYTD